MTGIYRIRNLINGKCYIGQSISIERRWREEKSGRVNRLLKEDFDKYGIENFSFEVIEECEKSKLNEKEKYYIENENSEYNIQEGGSGGSNYTYEELRERKNKQSKDFYKRHNDYYKLYREKHREKNIEYFRENRYKYSDYAKLICYDPIRNIYCTAASLQHRKNRNKKVYEKIKVNNFILIFKLLTKRRKNDIIIL